MIMMIRIDEMKDVKNSEKKDSRELAPSNIIIIPFCIIPL